MFVIEVVPLLCAAVLALDVGLGMREAGLGVGLLCFGSEVVCDAACVDVEQDAIVLLCTPGTLLFHALDVASAL